MRISRSLTAFILLCVMCIPAPAGAAYPDKPIRLIVPYAPGDSLDNAARATAEMLRKAIGTSVVVQNIPGGGSVTGTMEAKKAPADGYTIFVASPAYINASLIGSTGYTVKDFQPLAQIADVPFAVAVPAESPMKDLKDFVAEGRKRQLKFSTPGPNSSQRIVMTQFAIDNKMIPMLHVSGNGGAGATTKVLTGEVDFSFLTMPVSFVLAKGGKLRMLGAGSDDRAAYLPDIPTYKE